MISLNKKLEGRTLALRPSMRKFDGTGNMLEICGSASKPLGLFLNRQSIKIMEDLGVSDDFFINLQDKEVQRLRSIVDTPINASNFLKRHGVGIPFHFPWLLSELARLDIDFNQDPFISNTLQMTLLMELRNLKYRGRIPVEDGRHLYGIMDEYGVLEEGEICCSYMQDGIQRFVTGDKIFIIRVSLHFLEHGLVGARHFCSSYATFQVTSLTVLSRLPYIVAISNL